jgi:hypothetical protein
MTHDAGHGGVRAVPAGDPRHEAFLRMLAERELRWVVTEPDPPPAGELPVPPGDRPPPVPAVRAIDRFRDAAGALIAASAVDEQTAVAVLAGLLSALEQRAKLPRRTLSGLCWRPSPGVPGPWQPRRAARCGWCRPADPCRFPATAVRTASCTCSP